MNLRRFLPIVLVISLAALALAFPAFAQENESERVIALVAATDDFSSWLAEYEGWQGNAWTEDGTWYYVEFHDADDEWIGYAVVNTDTDEITESFIPRPLPQEAYDKYVGRVETLVLDDPEVQARLIDPVLWYHSVDYNRYDQVWEVWLSRGTDLLVVKATIDDVNFSISEIVDANVLEEETALQVERDEAVNLAYTGEGIDAALNGYDDWTAYAEKQHGHVWSVSFVTPDGTELYYALVNTEKDSVLEAQDTE